MLKQANKDIRLSHRSTEKSTRVELDHQEIEALAYRLWQERGAPIGSPEIDWSRAEDELKSRRQSSHRAA